MPDASVIFLTNLPDRSTVATSARRAHHQVPPWQKLHEQLYQTKNWACQRKSLNQNAGHWEAHRLPACQIIPLSALRLHVIWCTCRLRGANLRDARTPSRCAYLTLQRSNPQGPHLAFWTSKRRVKILRASSRTASSRPPAISAISATTLSSSCSRGSSRYTACGSCESPYDQQLVMCLLKAADPRCKYANTSKESLLSLISLPHLNQLVCCMPSARQRLQNVIGSRTKKKHKYGKQVSRANGQYHNITA